MVLRSVVWMGVFVAGGVGLATLGDVHGRLAKAHEVDSALEAAGDALDRCMARLDDQNEQINALRGERDEIKYRFEHCALDRGEIDPDELPQRDEFQRELQRILHTLPAGGGD